VIIYSALAGEGECITFSVSWRETAPSIHRETYLRLALKYKKHRGHVTAIESEVSRCTACICRITAPRRIPPRYFCLLSLSGGAAKRPLYHY